MSKKVVFVPVYNEEQHLEELLGRLREVYYEDVLFVDDGSQDCSPHILRQLEGPNTRVIFRHCNRGYGATLIAGFKYAVESGYDYLITMDSDGQHRPEWIPNFFETVKNYDIVSGSRYLQEVAENGVAPQDRKAINQQITQVINEITDYHLTDAFCGFKAYRVRSLAKLQLTELGYAMPLQALIQAAHFGLSLIEQPVSRIYDDPNRRFGGNLDDPQVRLNYYLSLIEKERQRWNM